MQWAVLLTNYLDHLDGPVCNISDYWFIFHMEGAVYFFPHDSRVAQIAASWLRENQEEMERVSLCQIQCIPLSSRTEYTRFLKLSTAVAVVGGPDIWEDQITY